MSQPDSGNGVTGGEPAIAGVEPADASAVPGTAPGGEPAGAPAAPDAERPSSEALLAALAQVYDPEIGIDIVNLGLVYDASADAKGRVTVEMTLTSPYCPMGSIIQSQAHAVCADLQGVEDVQVNLVWTPPWDPRTMASEEARLELGIY